MKNSHLLIPILFLSLITSLLGKKPNIVIVITDDQGYGDLGCTGNPVINTPHTDKLANESVWLTDYHVAPTCSPTRAALMSGHWTNRTGVWHTIMGRSMLRANEGTLGQFFKENGYETGMFGKWHMGGQRNVADAPPISDYGFDQSLTNFEGMGPKLLPLTLKPGQDPKKPGRILGHAEILGKGVKWMQRSKITEGFVDAAIPFIKKAKKEKKPFYVNLWPDDVHTPFWPPVDQWRDGSKRQLFLSVLEEMDRQLGKLFDHIHNDPALANNTIILACSDNGPEQGAGVAGPFRGYKTHLFEGGIRSSLVAWAPKLMADKAEGTINQKSIFSAIDLVPTLLEITGTKAPKNVKFDGESLPDVLLGKSNASRKQDILFRRPPDRDSFYGVKDLPDLAIRSGKWKLLCEYDGSDALLFDLTTDRAEKNNLAPKHPKVVKELSQKVIAWHKSMPPDNGPQMVGNSKKK